MLKILAAPEEKSDLCVEEYYCTVGLQAVLFAPFSEIPFMCSNVQLSPPLVVFNKTTMPVHLTRLLLRDSFDRSHQDKHTG